ncbi:TolC family protein [Undibacterium sp. Di26W]|uniref:TolC family protein n=1 Tax=Undibacterium sp. Di26W TaxID=3413035 RepID=UPI003BF434D8
MLFPVIAPRGGRPHPIRVAVLAGLLALSSFTALALDFPLTLGQAQQLAVARSRQLSAQDQAVTAAREMAVAAGQLPDPILKVGVDNLPVSGTDRGSLTSDFMTMRRVGVMQEITRADKRQLRTERYDRAADKALAEKTTTIAAIQRETAIAWLDRYYAEQMLAVAVEQIQQAKLEIEATQAAYRGGRSSQADVFSARSALAMADDRTSEFQKKLKNARTTLARWTGDTSDIALAGKPDIDSIRLDQMSLETSLAHHPQIAILNRQTEIAELDTRLAVANKKTDWTVEVAFQQRGPAYSNMVSIGLSLPFQWDQKNRQERELSSKLAMLEQSRAERDDMLRAHIAEAQIMITEWQSNRERATRYEHELIPLARERSQAVMAAYRGGKSSLIDVLAARRNELDTRLQTLQLQADAARLWAQLNFLTPADVVNKDMP